MTEAKNLDTGLYVLIGIFAAFILVILFVNLCMFANDFSRELKYVNGEINRTEGAEQRCWIRKRRRLWLSLIPFVKY